MAEDSVFDSMKYQAILCAKVVGCPVDDMLRLPGENFKNLVRQAAAFIGTVSKERNCRTIKELVL